MGKKPDMTGQIIGKWKVIKYLGPIKNRGKHTYYLCQCECGTERRVPRTNLIRQMSFSCQKCNHKRMKGKYKKRLAPVFSRIKKRTKVNGIELSVDHDYVLDLMNKQEWKCALTGLLLKVEYGENYTTSPSTASLDRIDSSKGYIPGNVQWVHKYINIMKWDLTQEEFIKMCKLVARRNK